MVFVECFIRIKCTYIILLLIKRRFGIIWKEIPPIPIKRTLTITKVRKLKEQGLTWEQAGVHLGYSNGSGLGDFLRENGVKWSEL